MLEYIEREALLRTLSKEVEYNDDGDQEINSDTVFIAIESAPAADVAEVVHGEWIYKGASVDGKRVYECSACHNDIYATGPYCKECGAKMDKEDET